MLINEINVDQPVAENIEILWNEAAVKEIFDNRAQLSINDSSGYFFDEVRRIGEDSYMPSDHDIMLVRHVTTGIVEQHFVISNNWFHIYDIGSNSEKKNWIHCFDNVTAVIFVASLSCYDERTFEDSGDENALVDSIILFEEICNLTWFKQTPMILFLNKRDLFRKK
eukprot:228335_1